MNRIYSFLINRVSLWLVPIDCCDEHSKIYSFKYSLIICWENHLLNLDLLIVFRINEIMITNKGIKAKVTMKIF